MVNLIIDNEKIAVPEGTTIIEAAKTAGIEIPTLCYLKDINEIGACRVCLVEIEGVNKLAAACNSPVTEGMVVKTNSPRVRNARKTNVELILSQHNCRCATCTRNGSCKLQSISRDLAYAIGVAEPVSVAVNCFDTEKISVGNLSKYIRNSYDLTPKGIIESLDLLNVDYNKVSAYGHFGKEGLPWEE